MTGYYPPQVRHCQNPGCRRVVREGVAYCFMCALFGGMRRIKPK